MNPNHTPLKPHFRFALILLTNRCNLACKHCYVESNPKGHEGFEKTRLLQLMDEFDDQFGRTYLSLSGGEALVRQDDCFEILERAAKTHAVQLVSNGTLIDAEVAERLVALGVAVKISVDGPTAQAHDWMRGNGAFEDAMRGVDNLLAAGLSPDRLSFGATIPTGNVEQIKGILELAESKGVERVRLDSVAKMGRARRHWPHLRTDQPDPDATRIRTYFNSEFKKEHGDDWRLIDLNSAVGMFETLHIYYDGEVYLYLNYDHPVTQEGRIGNLNENSLREVVESDAVTDAILRKMLRFSRAPERSFISHYTIRKTSDSGMWFEAAGA